MRPILKFRVRCAYRSASASQGRFRFRTLASGKWKRKRSTPHCVASGILRTGEGRERLSGEGGGGRGGERKERTKRRKEKESCSTYFLFSRHCVGTWAGEPSRLSSHHQHGDTPKRRAEQSPSKAKHRPQGSGFEWSPYQSTMSLWEKLSVQLLSILVAGYIGSPYVCVRPDMSE